ncbi:MAG: hypothetical protein WCC65_13220 [Pseudonocardiaceae bacterium]
MSVRQRPRRHTELTPDPGRAFHLWASDGAAIRTTNRTDPAGILAGAREVFGPRLLIHQSSPAEAPVTTRGQDGHIEHGTIRVAGTDTADLSARQLARLVAYVSQTPTITVPFTTLDIAVMGRTTHLSLTATPSTADRRAAPRRAGHPGRPRYRPSRRPAVLAALRWRATTHLDRRCAWLRGGTAPGARAAP